MVRKNKDKPAPAPRIVETYKILAKFADEVFCPSNAIEESFWKRAYATNVDIQFKTIDGHICRPEFHACWDDRDQRYDDEFDYLCNEKFCMSFAVIRSSWISRLGRVADYWHLIKLEKI